MKEALFNNAEFIAAVVALIGAIVWGFKIVVPRWIAAYEKTNDAKIEHQKQYMESSVKAQNLTAEAVSKIPEAIKSFELVHLGSEKRITERIDAAEDRAIKETQAAKERILDEITERRYILMVEKMRGSQPSQPGG